MRINFGISTGYTARLTMGAGPAKLADMNKYIVSWEALRVLPLPRSLNLRECEGGDRPKQFERVLSSQHRSYVIRDCLGYGRTAPIHSFGTCWAR